MRITRRAGADPDVKKFWNGTFKEHFDALVTSDGSTITMSLEQSGGGNLTLQFSDGNTLLDCTPACTIELTAGVTGSPQDNWVYILKSTKVLTKSTTGWPSEEHIRVAYFYVQSAIDVQDHGVLINQNWNDSLKDGNNTGHITHIGSWIRRSGARWFSGIDGAGSDGIIDLQNGDTEMYLQTNSGVVSQMHLHNAAAKDTSVGDYVHVANHPTTPFVKIQDVGTVLVDSTGVSMSGKYYNLVFGMVANKGGEYQPLMMKLPSGSYSNVNDAIDDVDGYTDLSMPRQFSKESSTGVLLYKVTVKHKTGVNTFTVHNEVDIREVSALTATGTGTGGTVTEFSDSQFKVFDNVDATKIIMWEASHITTGNTRTITAPDINLDLANPVFDTITSNGLVTIQPLVDGDVLLIKDSAGTVLFTVDTANSFVGIGNVSYTNRNFELQPGFSTRFQSLDVMGDTLSVSVDDARAIQIFDYAQTTRYFSVNTNSGYIQCRGHVLPHDGSSAHDNTFDFGISWARWRNAYIIGNITDNTNTVTVANLKTSYDHTGLTNNPHGVTATQVSLGNVDNVADADQTSLGTVTVGNVTAVVSAASKTLAGKVELTTTAEIDTGTDSTRAMPVDQFVASKRNIRWLAFNLVEAGTDVATGTNIGGDFVSPIAGTILQSDSAPYYIYSTNSTAGVTGTLVVDVSLNGTTIMGTNKIDTATAQKNSYTSSTHPDLTDTTIAVGDILTIDIDSIHTTAAKGLTVYMAVRES